MRDAQPALRRNRTARGAGAWILHRGVERDVCDRAFHGADRHLAEGATRMKLVVGSKNYSSWSLRGWLLLKHAGIPFEEIQLRFSTPDFKQQLLRHSPAGRV